MLERREQSPDEIRIADERLRSRGLDLGATFGVTRRAAHRVTALAQLAGQRLPTAPAADDQAARHAALGLTTAGRSRTRRRTGAELALDLLERSLGQAASASPGVGRLQQLVEIAIGEVRLAPTTLLIEVVHNSQLQVGHGHLWLSSAPPAGVVRL